VNDEAIKGGHLLRQRVVGALFPLIVFVELSSLSWRRDLNGAKPGLNEADKAQKK
jgi:hypothetical protein